MLENIEEILLTREQLESKTKELAKEINEVYKDKNPILLGLLKGSIIFISDLMKELNFKLEIDFMDVSSYYGASSSNEIKILKDIEIEVKNRHVLIAEDIIDTGQTLSKVISLLEERGALSVKVVALLDKPEARKIDMKADYIGFEIPKKFVVGYGLDYNENYRNLPFVGVLKSSVYN